jgi:hypothetical protein
MRSSYFTPNTNANANDVNNLRKDAAGGSWLLTHQQATPGMTVAVEPGVYYIGSSRIEYAGGSTGTITAPVSHPRIDLVCLDSSGTLSVVTGTEASSPTAPTYPGDHIVLAEIYNVVGEAAIYDNDMQVTGQGYLTDVRPIIHISQATDVDNTGTLTTGTVYTNTTGRLQLHIVHCSLTLAASGDTATVTATKTGGTRASIERTLTASSVSQDVTILPIVFSVAPGDAFQLTSTTTGSATITVSYWHTITL